MGYGWLTVRALLLPVEEAEEKDGKSQSRPFVNWVRVPRGPITMVADRGRAQAAPRT